MTALRYHSSQPKGWSAPVGSAAHEWKHGRIQPMEEPRSFFSRLFGKAA